MNNPNTEWLMKRRWYVGSEHGEIDSGDYRYDEKGWPFFIGIKETGTGKADRHIAGGIQDVELAREIVRLHNEDLQRC